MFGKITYVIALAAGLSVSYQALAQETVTELIGRLRQPDRVGDDLVRRLEILWRDA